MPTIHRRADRAAHHRRTRRGLLAAGLLVGSTLGVALLRPSEASAVPYSGGGWTSAGRADMTVVQRGATVTATVTVSAAWSRSGLIDLEIHDSDGRQVFQRYWDNEEFTADTPRTFSATWRVPTTAKLGDHWAHVAIFSVGWQTLNHWNHGVANVEVVATPPETTPTLPPTTTLPATTLPPTTTSPTTTAAPPTTTTTAPPPTTTITTTTSTTTAPPTTTTTTAPPTTTTAPPTTAPPTTTTTTPLPPAPGGRSFLATFDGAPSSPQPFVSPDWDVTVHARDDHGDSLLPMHAEHGPACSAPPELHEISGFNEAVFSCRDHVMTAFNASGYGVIYLTPDHLVDFSAGEAVVSFDVSTAKFSTRDWWDVWITPYEDHLQLAIDDVGFPDLQGAPRRAVHVSQIDFEGVLTGFEAQVYREFARSPLPMASAAIERRGVLPSSTDRTKFEVRISRTSLKFCVPSINYCSINTTFADLGWDQGVLQIGHHSYDPTKDDKFLLARPNTWHWDNVSIAPAIPFRILHADRRVTYDGGTAIRFDGTAAADSYLRFAGYGPNGETFELSTDGGSTWTAARRQPASQGHTNGHHASYWTPIPAGTSQVNIRARGTGPGAPNGSRWYIRDMTIFTDMP